MKGEISCPLCKCDKLKKVKNLELEGKCFECLDCGNKMTLQEIEFKIYNER